MAGHLGNPEPLTGPALDAQVAATVELNGQALKVLEENAAWLFRNVELLLWRMM